MAGRIPGKKDRRMEAGPSLDSRALEVFLTVCAAGSMTSAARQLGITQGAVSQQISRLENLLQLKLIERENREFRLLPAGVTLQHHAQRVIDELRATERSMQRFRGFSLPSLSVLIMDTLEKTLTSTVIETLQDVVEQMQVGAALPSRHRDDLVSGKIDMIVTALDFSADAFEIHPLATETLVLLMPKGAFPGPQQPELDELASALPLIRYASQRHLGPLIESYLTRQLINVVRSIEVDQATAVIDTVRAGRGWAIATPFSLLDPAFDPERIDVAELPRPVPQRAIKLVSRRAGFFDIPARLAENCRTHLRRQMEMKLYGVVPSSAYPVVVGTPNR